jgi:hypothetical protein
MKNQTINYLTEQIQTSVEIKNLLLKLWILEESEIPKNEIDSMIKKFQIYQDFKNNELQILQTEKEFLIVWHPETGHTEKFTISKLKEENEKEGFFEWVPTFLESEHFLNNMKVGQVELMETQRDFEDDNLKVAVYRIK